MNRSKLVDEIGNFTAFPNWAVEMGEQIGPDGLVLLLALRYHSGTNDEVFPSYDTLEKHTGLTRRRIAKAIRHLETLKIIERRKRFSQSTIYILKNPSISTAGVLMDELPLVQQVDCISTGGVLPLVQQVHSNKTHLTRLKEQDSREVSSLDTIIPSSGNGDHAILKDPKFRDAWHDWEDYRSEIKKKMTQRTKEKQLEFLSNYDAGTAAAIINQSIQAGWTGLFELKKNGKPINLVLEGTYVGAPE